jgi:phenylalanyl-tRNA synthetase alpha chain
MQKELAALIEEAKAAIAQSADCGAVEHLRVHYLGKKGQLTALLKSVSNLPPADRPQMGKIINEAKQELLELLSQQDVIVGERVLKQKLQAETVDITLPGRGQLSGALHPVTQVKWRVIDLFTSMGFSVADGPEIEDDYHNFEALNIPAHHPARDSHDTFFFPSGLLLRTHTSNVQIRTMEQRQPPLRIITLGRVYRCDYDQTHTPMFHQLEGLVVDTHCNMGHLKSVLQDFLEKFFETELEFRFRPSFFPFTEPSAEVDMRKSDGGWLEILGCGMVHPQVLKNVGIDPEKYTGFAFGLGLDRLAMLKYAIPDLRLLFENDLRLLTQF